MQSREIVVCHQDRPATDSYSSHAIASRRVYLMPNLPPKNVLLSIFTKMSLLKQNDERMRAATRQGKIFAPYYSYRGQEVIPSAVSTVLRPTDYVCTVYRGIHDMLAQGCPVDKLWAEVAGRATGSCKGKGGAMHISHASTGVMVTTGIVGSSLPIANGLAWGSQLKDSDAVTVAYFGDGASNIGHFHESLNMASLILECGVVVASKNLRFMGLRCHTGWPEEEVTWDWAVWAYIPAFAIIIPNWVLAHGLLRWTRFNLLGVKEGDLFPC